jgi:transaldolase
MQSRIKLYLDGADLASMSAWARDPRVSGFTTNPSLMRKAGVTDYAAFAREALEIVQDKPISFEVLSDDFDEMERQARVLAGWGANVYVKIPVMNSKGESSVSLIGRLSASGVRVNVTAVMTATQVLHVASVLAPETPSIVSVFAGRIADTGIDPVPIMEAASIILEALPKTELLWASTREVWNVVQAELSGCHIITVTADVLGKLSLLGKDLVEFSRETAAMFVRDAEAAGYTL